MVPFAKTTDGGNTWDQQSNTGNHLNGVYFIDAYTGWAVGNNGTIRKTTDGGDTWDDQTSPVNDQLNEVVFTSATNGWIVGNNGTILYTSNGGDTWTEQTSNYNNSISSVYFVNGSYGWSVGTSGTVQSYILVTLPANFASFEASSTDCSAARLQWQTAGDASNHRFEILWSTDGSKWKTVGTVNATAATSYSYNYTGLAQGANYLKLKEVAQDGQFIYSKTDFHLKIMRRSKRAFSYSNSITRLTVTVQLYNTSLTGHYS